MRGKLVQKTAGWYRKDYDQPAPIPVDYNEAENRVSAFWPQKETSWLLQCNWEEAESMHKLAASLAEHWEKLFFEPLNGKCSLQAVKWTRPELYRELIERPLQEEDVHRVGEGGLSIDLEHYPLLGEGMTTYEEGKPKIHLRVPSNGFEDTLEQRMTIIHELIHIVYSAPNVLQERRMGGIMRPHIGGVNIDDIIDFEAQRVCLQRPQLVDYAVKTLKLK